MKNALKAILPFATQPAPVAGFGLKKYLRDSMGTRSKNYTIPEVSRGKQWFVFYYFRNPETNEFERFKVKWGIKKAKDKEAWAEELRAGVEDQLRKGFSPFSKDPVQIVVKNWTLIQGLNFFKQNLETRGLRKRTVQTYSSVLKMLYKFTAPIASENIKEVSKQHIQQILLNAHRKNEWSNTTYNNNLTFVKAIFSYLIDQEILEVNPAERIKRLPQQITKHKYFDERTFKRIRENADPGLLSFIMFLYHTGTRPNEARQLTHENILIDRKLLFIPAGISKNKKDDYVPLTDYVIKNYGGRVGYLFKQSVNHYGRMFAKLKKKLKLDKDHTLYSIKSSRAIHLAQDGADPYTIMLLFRHSGLDITMAYLKGLGIAINREATTKGIKF
jgi:integrase